MAGLEDKFTSYYDKDAFFKQCEPYGLTFDDISLATRYSEILPKEAILEGSLGDSIRLSIPLISSDMDTVTESKMAIAMALQGGLGLIHYNMMEADQVKEVARVKNHIHGLIQEPVKVHPDELIGAVLARVQKKGYDFRTFPVVDLKGKVLGLLPSRVMKERYEGKTVQEAMIPRSEVHVINKKNLGRNPIATADKYFTQNIGVHKLLVIDDKDRLCGLFTSSDVERIGAEAKNVFKPARDSSFRLLCGAAVSSPRTPVGNLDSDRILNHVSNLIGEGVDTIAISSAHAHTKGVGEVIKLIHKHFKDLPIIAGNVTSAEGVEFLARVGATAIKVGQGPGSICTTRIVAGVGIPQITALYNASKVAKKKGVKIIADGGITKSGDIVKALTLSDAVICGSLLAGCTEAPGKIMEINGKFYKEYRGMGSLQAMQSGSAARYGHEAKDTQRKVASEGIEALKEVSGSVEDVIAQLIGGLQSGMGYVGAKNLSELQSRARYICVSSAGQVESAPHDVIELKTTQ